MSFNRYARRVDASAQQTIDELEALGYQVIRIGRPVDVIVRHFSWPVNIWAMGELKTPKKGKLKLRKDQQDQQEFCSLHGIPYWIDGLSAVTWLEENRP